MNPILDILYIGNNPEYFQVFADSKKYSIKNIENAIKALKYLNKSKTPDAIICEYNLSGNTGLYLFDKVKEHSEFRSLPFVLVSKVFNPEVYKQAFKKRVDDYYIMSGTLPEDIMSRLEFLCQNKSTLDYSKTKSLDTEVFKMPLTKRLFDILVASSVLLVASPFLLLIILAIRLESKGKVYYISKRVGRKTFDFYKLRSMKTGSDDLLKKLAQEKNQYGNESKATNDSVEIPCPKCSKLPEGEACSDLIFLDNKQICEYWYSVQKVEKDKNSATFIKIVDDPRVTKVGKFIRNTSIDELPQLINVLKGDMSIVGNRPLPVYEAELLTGDALSKRFLAPPGITGLWQVELRGKGGEMSEEERMRLDNEYADHFKGDNYSFWYDINLIFRTIPALLQKGAV